ncbi:MAG: tetratricopeptide repeat protein [Planctomycetaceae bacterium]|jgi:tetratricopeptide (TPR) repeat protein|nr:tetratricopeptide repeat protein [Planctomycetaceae bacterium]
MTTLPGSVPPRPDRPPAWQAAVLLGVTLLAYAPVLDAGFVWNDDDLDDILALVDREGLATVWFSTETFNYWPVTWTSYWLEHEVFGDDPATGRPRPTSYHIVNVLIHATCSLLLWRVLVRLGVPGAWLAGLIFAVHPVNVESVAWVTQRKNVLAMVFFLASLRWWLDFQQFGGRPRYTAAVIAFLLGMLSKGAIVACPLVLLLLAWWRWGRITRQNVLQVLPFLVISGVMSVAEIWFQHVKAIGGDTIRDAGLAERLMAIGPIAWFYLGKALLPLNLCFVYPRWQFDVSSIVEWLPAVAGVVILGSAWATRRSLTRAPLTAILYYLLCLGPIVGLVDIYFFKYSLVADHYQYVALPGVIALVIGTGTHLARRYGIDGTPARIVSAGLVVVLSGLTWQQSANYQSPQRLWLTTLQQNPGCWMAHNQLGNLVTSTRQLDGAREHYRAALKLIERQLGPEHVEAARVHHNLGVLLGQASRQATDAELVTAAVEHLETACRLAPDRGDYLVSLAGVRQEQGDQEQAIGELQRFIQRHPGASKRTWQTLAGLLREQGRPIEAAEALRRGRAVDPRRQER